MVANLPLVPRPAYFAFRRYSRVRCGTNLKGILRGTQWSQTAVPIASALSSVAEAWIFQPCNGNSPACGRSSSQSPERVCRQPSGTGRSETGKAPASGVPSLSWAESDKRSGVS